MDKSMYDGQLRRQCLSLKEMCEPQIEGLKKGLSETIPADEYKKVRRIYFTGCGDSYFAAKAAVPVFKHYAGAFGNGFTALRNIDAARKIDFSKDPESTMLIAISASGGPARVEEALTRARKSGCKTLLVTNNTESRSAKASEYLFVVNTPTFPEMGPGLRNYYASLSGLYTLAVHMGVSKGFVKEEEYENLFNAIRDYTNRFMNHFDEIDDLAFKTAVDWKDTTAIEAIADNLDYPSAAFICAKFVEVDGKMTTVANSEDWCHVNYFADNEDKIGTIVMSTSAFPNLSRIKETLFTVSKIGRKVLVISDGNKSDYTDDDNVCFIKIVKPSEGYEFIAPLLNHLPGDIIASYSAALDEEPYFRGSESRQSKSAIGNTIRDSVVEII